MSEETSTALYHSIHIQPSVMRELLVDWDGPTEAARQLNSQGRILLTGTGTSYHAAVIGEYFFRRAGLDAWAIPSYEFVTYPRPLRSDDGVIVISHRGSKIYGISSIQRAKQAGVQTIGITGADSQMRDVNLMLETTGQEKSSTHSVSFIGAITRLAQIASRLSSLRSSNQAERNLAEGLGLIPAYIEQIFLHEDTLRGIAQNVIARNRRVFYVGAGPNAPIAKEGALKAMEASYITAEGYELEQVIHGPFVSFEPGDLVVVLSVKGPSQQRIADFLHALNEIGTHVLLLGVVPLDDVRLFSQEGWTHIDLDLNVIEELTPFLTVVPLQLLADFYAATRGVDADSFRRDQEIYKRAGSTFSL